MHLNTVFLNQMSGQMLRTIDRPVLPTCAAETNLQVRETPFLEALHVMVHQRINALQEPQDLPVLFQKVNHRLVQSRELLILLVLTRIVRTSAVKHITSSVPGSILRNPFLEREAINGYYQFFCSRRY